MRRRIVLTVVGLGGVLGAFLLLASTLRPGDFGGIALFAPFIAILAIEYGAIAGAVAAALGTALFFLALEIGDGATTASGVASRLLPMLVLGTGVGWLGDRLRESEASYRRIVETAGELIWAVDEHGITTFVNDRVRSLLGYEPDELVGRSAASLLRGEEVVHGEHELAAGHKDGSEVWLRVNATPNVDRHGRFAGLFAMCSDITARRRAEAEVAKHQRALEEAQQIAHIGSWAWDIAENRITWSDELYRIYGLDPEKFEASYEAFVERIHPDDRQPMNEAVQSAYGTGAPFVIEHRIVRPAGDERVLEARGFVFREGSARPTRMAGTAHDITERKLAETALAEARAELAAHELGRSQARELNDTVVQGLVLAKYALEREQNSAAKRAVDSALVQARRMINDLLGDGDVQPGQLRREDAAGVGDSEQ